MNRYQLIPLIVILLICTQCGFYGSGDPSTTLTSVTIIDNNGFTQTITSQDRLQQYANVDFAQPQAYQRVLRVYGRNKRGDVIAVLTSYHENGGLKQYLEAKNNSAYGAYREWYQNGKQRLEAMVINGTADLTPLAEKSWIFEGPSTVWDEEGNLSACINYSKGQLEGKSTYYHANGTIWKTLCFHDGLIEGPLEIYLANGQPLQVTHFVQGKKQGLSTRYWPTGKLAAEEHYSDNLLTSATYWDKDCAQVGKIIEGRGTRVLFSSTEIAEIHQYKHGLPDGKVQLYDATGTLVQVYHVRDGEKHGEEIVYNEKKLGVESVKPKLSITWYKGKIQGPSKTWYDNGALECQRELSNNRKNGMLTAWYRDGSLMMIEDYEQDQLVRGEYYKQGDKRPTSQVWDGSGIATLYDSEGNFMRKITYHHGKPQE